MARYCTYCGNEVNENAVVCVKCGCAIPGASTHSSQGGYTHVTPVSIVDTITQRIKTNGIIWIVISAIQILLGIFLNWTFLIVGVLNLVSSIQDLKYSKEFPNRPVGIVAKVKPIATAIVVLVYNLIVGGIIGVAGSIYYFVAVRSYVLENEQAFLEIENQYCAV